MIRMTSFALPLLLSMTAVTAGAGERAPTGDRLDWATVVNNGDYMPTASCDPASAEPATTCRRFNSYNQPSVNFGQLVVIRARSRGGQGMGQPVHGIFTRDMATREPVVRILDRSTQVPQPNNRGTQFVEPPSFPRIDIHSATLATRGNHPPAWRVTNENGETVTQVGTSGIYANPFDSLITAASKLGGVSQFAYFGVPELPGTPFDVFPGSPAVTDGNIIVFKGNYTDAIGKSRTGVYFRELVNASLPTSQGELSPAGGTNPVLLIANNDTPIPGTSIPFGSTAPPSAAAGMAVFAGFDNEEQPTAGGIYLASLTQQQPPLRTLVSIGGRVPGEKKGTVFNRIGEGISFDGRFVAFWAAWGAATRSLLLTCPEEGNAARVAFCKEQYPEGFAAEIPLNQGIFVHDIRTGNTVALAKTPRDFDDFLYWNFSGHVPGGEGDGDDGEPARWRATAFVAVSGMVNGTLMDPTFHAVFKGRTGEVVSGSYENPVDGIYLARGPNNIRISTLIQSGMAGTLIDAEAFDPETEAALPVTEMGVERDGFRGRTIVVNVGMGSEETGWAGIYLTEIQ